jgi:hypothetical protein
MWHHFFPLLLLLGVLQLRHALRRCQRPRAEHFRHRLLVSLRWAPHGQRSLLIPGRAEPRICVHGEFGFVMRTTQRA